MSDSLRLYSTLLRAVGKAHPHEDPRRLKVFAWLVTGLLLEKSVSLPWLATVLVSAAKAASRVRRRRRFLANPRVPVRADSDGLIRAALAGWAGRTISLAIDTTSWAGRLVVCRVAVIYRGRAVPLVWQVDERTSVMLAFADDQALLEHARPLVPPGATIILLGDRGFRTTKLMDWCDQDPNWHFRLRLKGDQLVRLPDYQHAQAVSTVRLKRGMVRFLHGVWLGGESYGPIEMAMAWADTPEAEPWYIASDETAARQTLTEYGLRMDVETVHFYLKTRVGLEDCRVQSSEAVDKYMVVVHLAWAYVEQRFAQQRSAQVRTYGDILRRHRDEQAIAWLMGASQMAIETGDPQAVLRRFLRLEALPA